MVQISLIAAVALFSSLAAGVPVPSNHEIVQAAHQPVVEVVRPAHKPVEVVQPAHRPVEVVIPHQPQPVIHTTPAHIPVRTPVHEQVVVIKTTQAAHIPPVVVHQPTVVQHAPVVLPTHGSGAVVWQEQEYNDCVQQCVATHGNAPGKVVLPTVIATKTAGSVGTGATHTVIVAPSQGVFRYIPFAVNATVGDTIKFVWGANGHTVTKSSQLLPCNRTSEEPFASGRQDSEFIFTQVVNDTKPAYFHCAVGTHCQQGMFGIINPTTQFASPSSVGRQITSIGRNSSNVAGYSAHVNSLTKDNALAARWGSSIELEGLPEWAHEYVAENVLYTRSFLAANPELLKEDGSVDLSTAATVPLAIPQDIAQALNNAGAASSSTTLSATAGETVSTTAGADAAASPAVESPAPAANAGSQVSSGSALTSSKALVALTAVLATIFLL